MFNVIEKLSIKFLKLFFSIILVTFMLFMHILAISDYDYIFVIIYLFVLYIYAFTAYILIVALFEKFDKLYFYNGVLSPLIPSLFYLINIIQYKDFSDINSTDILFLITIYLGSFLFTIFYLSHFLDKFIRLIVGKHIPDFILGDDYSYISIYSKSFPELGDKFGLIEDIIQNLLNYQFIEIRYISYKGNKYPIYKYTRQDLHNSRPHSNNILLVNMNCIDINYIEWFDQIDLEIKNYELNENPTLLNFECIDKDSIDLNDLELIEDASYDCFFINQYYESGDEIFHSSSIENETYLALANLFCNTNVILQENENGIIQTTSTENDPVTKWAIKLLSKTKIVFHKNDDVFVSPELWNVRSNIFKLYYFKTYGTLLNKLRIILNSKIRKKHKTIISIILGILIIFYIFIKIIMTYKLDLMQFITFIASIPTAIYSTLWIYDRFKNWQQKN